MMNAAEQIRAAQLADLKAEARRLAERLDRLERQHEEASRDYIETVAAIRERQAAIVAERARIVGGSINREQEAVHADRDRVRESFDG